ncbi:MAG: hypothetical protein HRT67_12615 [Flavobacteriaceae bacterium]|nr:hypothetical protein [Flavobacteriaceae bacterium]
MKGIKHILGLLMFACLLWSCNDDIDRTFTKADGEFVRFFMLVDNDNNVLEYPQVSGGLIPVDTYTKDKLGVLKIPVVLSAINFENEITVNFATEFLGNLQGVSIEPEKTLSFNSTKLTDTISVNFENIWNGLNNPSIKFSLTDISDSNIYIGMPNTNLPNDILTINLEDVEFNYTLQNSLEEIIGLQDEEALIGISFPNGFFEDDINGIDLLNEVATDNIDALAISYDLEVFSVDEASSTVFYKYTISEDLNDEFLYETKFQLADIPGYTIGGITEITIRKPLITPRDNSVNTAANFYNLDDPYYRTYGENWMDFNEDGICSWQAFHAFTYPVVVNANHPNAVLDDLETTDPSDDIYHHAFRIGFDSPNAGNTTNSFNLKRWFNNESISATNSPGFNILEALDFFPENGTSTTNGFVQVVAQDIIIADTNGNSYTIAITGEGTYQETSSGIFEIQLELQATNQQLFGGTRVAKYVIYNTPSFPEPNDLTEDCFVPISL